MLRFCVVQSSPLEWYAIGVYAIDMIVVAETKAFQRNAGRLLSEREKEDLIYYLAEHPNSGTLIKDTGGIRKLRWAKSGRGKSGGIRAIYYYHNELMPPYLLAALAKTRKPIFLNENGMILPRVSKNW